MIAGVLLNVGLNWILIYGNLGAPAMGLDGARRRNAAYARVAVAAAIIVYMLLAPCAEGQPACQLAGYRSRCRNAPVAGNRPSTGGMHLAEGEAALPSDH